MRAYEIIHRKRDGGAIPPEAIAELVGGFTRGEIPDYQMAAFCMAVFFRGMDEPEVRALTEAMLRSGDVLDLSDIPGAKVDKHSTGGVGDKVSLALAPLVAACGVKVPMISGRGLGHTGGTLDKLEAIPGFRVDLPVETFRALVREVGACLIGQTARLAPADRKLYALRDVTATVESIPLIAASIMSKKLAEGIDALVLDVKVGSGAFMKHLEDARALARTLAGIGRGMGKRVSALLTRMDEPLGRAVGNALEVEETVALLSGGGPEDLREVTVELTAEMLVLGSAAPDLEAARARVEAAIADGRGLSKLEEIVRAQGGDPAALHDPERLPRAPFRYVVAAPAAGFVTDDRRRGDRPRGGRAGRRARARGRPRRPGGRDRRREEARRARRGGRAALHGPRGRSERAARADRRPDRRCVPDRPGRAARAAARPRTPVGTTNAGH